MTIHNVFAIFLLLATAPCALAGGNLDAALKPAQQALAAGDYKKAYTLYSRYTAKNPLAQFTLGLFHKNGWGRPADPVAACGWFEKAAHKNIPAAQQFFGDCLAQGIGRTVDGEAAVGWYRKAAASGIAYALCSAGDLYVRGAGVDKDMRRGLELCAQAAQAESPPAMLRLADYYREGKDVPQDLAAARHWYQQAAERHSPEAQYRLGVMLGEGQGGEADLNAALFWLETAAGEGYAPAYLPTAILYANAEVDTKTGALKPEHLAKIYLWNSAAKARTADPAQLAEIERVEKLVLAVMPETWRPDLDKKVAEHLAKYGNK
ncbi:MAG: tetratricopeptide repeat protein [Gallionella sp.]